MIAARYLLKKTQTQLTKHGGPNGGPNGPIGQNHSAEVASSSPSSWMDSEPCKKERGGEFKK